MGAMNPAQKYAHAQGERRAPHSATQKHQIFPQITASGFLYFYPTRDRKPLIPSILWAENVDVCSMS
jgi:hypothetical protein